MFFFGTHIIFPSYQCVTGNLRYRFEAMNKRCKGVYSFSRPNSIEKPALSNLHVQELAQLCGQLVRQEGLWDEGGPRGARKLAWESLV